MCDASHGGLHHGMGWIERRRTCVSGLHGHRIVPGTLDGMHGYECLVVTAGTSIEHTASVEVTYISPVRSGLTPYLAGFMRASEESSCRIGYARDEILLCARTTIRECAATAFPVEEGVRVLYRELDVSAAAL